MSNEITLSSSFMLSRTSKAGKITERTALGVSTSGNRLERAALNSAMFQTLVRNCTYGVVMHEVQRVFPFTMIKATAGVCIAGDGTVMFRSTGTDGKAIYDDFSPTKPNKHVLHQYANAVIDATRNKELKGEKALYLGFLREMLSNELTLQIKLADAACQADATEAA